MVPSCGEFNLAAVRLTRLGPGPLGVKLVGEMREHDPPGAGAPAVLPGFARGEVPPLARALRPGERRFDQQHVGVTRELRQLVVGAAVSAVRHPPTARES